MVNIQIVQQQYISEWHDNFVNHIRGILGIIEVMTNYPSATDKDKRGFDQIKMLLNGREVLEIERSLAVSDVKREVLDKIEKLYKDMVDVAIEYLSTEALLKVFLKKLSYYQIEQNKRLAERRLNDLKLLKKEI